MIRKIWIFAPLGTLIFFPAGGRADDISMVGKYLCVVSHLAGIQYEKDGRKISGNFKPAEGKFFLTIRSAKHIPADQWPCKNPTDKLYWPSCLAKYDAQVDNGILMKGDDQYLFYDLLGGDYLSITSDANPTFERFNGILSTETGLFVSDGKCTRL